jgi:serine/threonine kinase PknH
VSWVLLRPSTPSAPAAGSAAPTTTPLTTSPDAEAQRRLTGLLPAGYSPSSCESSPAPKDAVAEMVCARNADPGGPAAASYTLVPEHRAVNTTLDEHLPGSTVVTCPGNIQSPGPWRRQATPQQISGTLVCSYRDGLASITWTTEAELLVSAVRADRRGPSRPALPVVVQPLMTRQRHAGGSQRP